jgi:hypothetical protein
MKDMDIAKLLQLLAANNPATADAVLSEYFSDLSEQDRGNRLRDIGKQIPAFGDYLNGPKPSDDDEYDYATYKQFVPEKANELLRQIAQNYKEAWATDSLEDVRKMSEQSVDEIIDQLMYKDNPDTLMYWVPKKYIQQGVQQADTTIPEQLVNAYAYHFNQDDDTLSNIIDTWIKDVKANPENWEGFTDYSDDELKDMFEDALGTDVSFTGPVSALRDDLTDDEKRDVYNMDGSPYFEALNHNYIDVNKDGDTDVTTVDTTGDGKPDIAAVTPDDNKELKAGIKTAKKALGIDKKDKTSTGKTKEELDPEEQKQKEIDRRQSNIIDTLSERRF